MASSITPDAPTTVLVHVPLRFKRRSGRKEILLRQGFGGQVVFPTERAADQAASPAAQRLLVLGLARAHRWLELLEEGRFSGVAEVAEAAGCDPSYVRRMLNLTLLAPGMVERVLDGMEGDEEGLERLARGAGVVWNAPAA